MIAVDGGCPGPLAGINNPDNAPRPWLARPPQGHNSTRTSKEQMSRQGHHYHGHCGPRWAETGPAVFVEFAILAGTEGGVLLYSALTSTSVL